MKKILDFILKNKLTIIIALITVTIITFIVIYFSKSTYNAKEQVKIVQNTVNELKLVDYDNENFSMKIPEGWTVETGGKDMFYAVRVYNPNDDRYQIFAILKAEPFLKNDKAKAWYQNYYNMFGGENNALLAKAIVMYEPTVEAFYSSFNEYTKYTKEVDTIYDSFNFPDLRNFAMVESFESNSSMKSVALDDKTLRATFQDTETGENGEGLFMATITSAGSYMALGYDTMFYSIYNIMGITTGECDLINYEKILSESLSSLVYKDNFVNQTIQNGNERTKNTLAMNASIQEAFNSYNSAWSARQKTYDITSQKYSDATLGYERVYNTETGEIYKAYNGFTDDYTGSKYESITDDMYAESVSGYIEK